MPSPPPSPVPSLSSECAGLSPPSQSHHATACPLITGSAAAEKESETVSPSLSGGGGLENMWW